MKFTRSRAVATAAAGMLAASTLAAVTLTAGPADAATTSVLHPHVGAKHRVHMADQVRPGVHKFVVSSAKQAELQIFTKRKGYTDRELARDINAAMGQGDTTALKRFERNVTLIGGVVSAPKHPGVMWLNLPRGHYVALDIDQTVTRAAKMHHLRVKGNRLDGTLPTGRTIRAIHETDWAARPKSVPARGIMTFANRSEDNHFIALAKLLPGKTIADFKAWIEAGDPNAPAPIDESAPEVDSGLVSPGHRMSFRYHLQKGSYVLTCWWPDADMGGMPHAMMGMYRQLEVR